MPRLTCRSGTSGSSISRALGFTGRFLKASGGSQQQRQLAASEAVCEATRQALLERGLGAYAKSQSWYACTAASAV